jgi:hypothetical protein
VLKEAKRYNVLACGRRWGKTTLGINLLVRPALEGKPVGWFALTYKLILEVWRWLETTLAPVLKRTNATERRMELITGGVIEFWTLNDPDAGRGRKYARVVIDEAGLVGGLLDIWRAAIRPTLTDLAGDAWFMGTPKGYNDFYKLYKRSATEIGWQSWQQPTEDNPFIPPSEVAAMRVELGPTIASQEVDALFVEGAGQFFEAWSPIKHVVAPEPIGADWILWGAFDHGFAHNTAFGVLALKPNGDLQLIGEHVQHKWLPDQHAPAMLALLGRLGLRRQQLRTIAAGHDVFQQRADGQGITLAQQYQELGWSFGHATVDRINGWSALRRRLGNETIVPTFAIWDTCPRTIATMPMLLHDPRKPEDVLKMDCDADGDGGDDCGDMLRYGVMDVPMNSTLIRPRERKTNMWGQA